MDELFPTIVYLLCFITSAICAGLLGRAFRRTTARVLLWSAICFAFLALNNLVVVIDLVLLPDAVTLTLPRHLLSIAAVSTLIFGFIWDLER
ncbi:hypothetical protein H7F51_09375 [Novosphingobium flavum]|uniref:Uncharacterized protein n=1 Tax=Novosphingobium flavum TaxID=1778672 RepID=A0A7X1FRP4_9SPHN|nr:DUF5985 family protein [Novosphingobium flavum]MBC2665734.1 hypothetical protein [Novosphingobium flavum]